MQMQLSWLRNLVIALWMLGTWQTAIAVTVQGGTLVGDQERAQRAPVALAAGNYRLHLLDPFATEHFALAEAGALLSRGSDRVVQLALGAGSSTAFADFNIASAGELDLFVHAATGQATGAAVVAVESLSGATAGQRVFEQAFSFSRHEPDSDRYAFHDTVKLAVDTDVHIDLTDMHALSFSFAPFEAIIVRVANTTATEVFGTWCWYQGVVSAADAAACVNMNGLSAPDGQTLSQTLAMRAGFLSWYVTAKAPLAQTSQLGWRMLDVSADSDLGEDVVIVNRSGDHYAREVGRFTLGARTAVDVDLNALSDVVSPFKLAIVSTDSGNAIRLDNNTLYQTGVTLNAGEYRILLSDDLSGDQGLLGIRVNAGATQLFDDVFSLGDFQRLGQVESTGSGSTPVTLSLHEFRQPLDVRIANATAVALRLTDTAQTGSFTRAPGRYSVWGRFDADAEDDLYRVRVGSGANILGEFLAATGTRLIEQREVTLSAPVSGTMAVRNFAFPDVLGERFRMILVQDDGTPLKFDVDSADGDSVQAAVTLAAGVAHIALFASQDTPTAATVIGYRFEYDAVSGGEPAPTPPRSANGSGGKSKGGGGFSSFLLYVLLMFKILRQRKLAASAQG
jgi:hypothetical protein